MIREEYAERGVILIALLWIMVALSIIAFSFSREGFVEVAAARNARDLTDAYYIARAGIAMTLYQVLEKRTAMPVQGIELGPPDPIDLGEVQGTFGGGEFKVELQDESGKININFVMEEQLQGLMAAIGIPTSEADVITDSILDWKDVDTAHHLNGAEDDYYQALPRPYKAKNGRIDTVEELLLVRGVTRDFFYGFRQKAPDGTPYHRYGLYRYLTVYSTTNRVNVNFAEPAVLLSVPGMDPGAAEAIYQRRKVKPFKHLGELTQELGVTLDARALPLLQTEPTITWTLTATAHMVGSKAQRRIRAVVASDPREPSQFRILYWNENVPIV